MPYDNNLSGALFKNKRKERDNQPDYTGNCEIEGTEYWVSGWIKTPRAGGDKFMSLAFTEKDAPAEATPKDYDEGDIPF